MYDRNYIYTVQHCKLMIKNKEIWSFNVRTYLTGVNKLEEFGKVSIFTSVFNDVYPCVEEFCVDLAEAEKKGRATQSTYTKHRWRALGNRKVWLGKWISLGI